MGSILANFFLKHYPKNLKKKKEKVDGKHEEIVSKFKSILRPRTKVDLKFSLFGLRNLINAAIKPEITIGLTDDRGEKIQLEWKRRCKEDKSDGRVENQYHENQKRELVRSVGVNDVMTTDERKEFAQKWKGGEGGGRWRWSKVFDFT